MPSRSEKQKKALEEIQKRNRERWDKNSKKEKPKDMGTQTDDPPAVSLTESPQRKRKRTCRINLDDCFIETQDSDETNVSDISDDLFNDDSADLFQEQNSDKSFEEQSSRKFLMIG